MKNLGSHIIFLILPIIFVTGNIGAQNNKYQDDVYDAGKPIENGRSENTSSPNDSSGYHDPNDTYNHYYRRPYFVNDGYSDPLLYPHPFLTFWPFYNYYRPHPFWFGWGGWGWHNHGNHNEGGDSYYGNRFGNTRNNNRNNFFGRRRELFSNRSATGREQQRGLSQGRSIFGTAHSRPGSTRGGFGSTGRRGFSSTS